MRRSYKLEDKYKYTHIFHNKHIHIHEIDSIQWEVNYKLEDKQ